MGISAADAASGAQVAGAGVCVTAGGGEAAFVVQALDTRGIVGARSGANLAAAWGDIRRCRQWVVQELRLVFVFV